MLGRHHYVPKAVSLDMESLIPRDHLLRKIDRLVNFSFVHDLCAPLYSEHVGRPSIDPEVFFRIALVTYLYGIPSDRQVAQELQYNLAYRWFCRLPLEGEVPDHSSLTRFRDRLGEKTFREIFERILRVCFDKGLIQGTHVMIDGSLIKADAALNSMVERPKEGEKLEDKKPSKYIRGKRFSNETHVSKTDPDATLAGKQGEPKKLAYKVHETIDRESRLVLDAHVTTGADPEGKVMFSRLDAYQQRFGKKVEEVTADRGYGYGENLEELEKRKIRHFVPNFHKDVGDNYDPALFTYDEQWDRFTCMQGFELTPANVPSSLAMHMQIYRILGGHCAECPLQAKCFGAQRYQNRGRRICRNLHWKVQKEVRDKEKDAQFRAMRRERQWKMEGIFAEAKDNHGLERARYRGRAKMQIQAYLTAFVQNIKRLLALCPATIAVQKTIEQLIFTIEFSNFFPNLKPINEDHPISAL